MKLYGAMLTDLFYYEIKFHNFPDTKSPKYFYINENGIELKLETYTNRRSVTWDIDLFRKESTVFDAQYSLFCFFFKLGRDLYLSL